MARQYTGVVKQFREWHATAFEARQRCWKITAERNGETSRHFGLFKTPCAAYQHGKAIYNNGNITVEEILK